MRHPFSVGEHVFSGTGVVACMTIDLAGCRAKIKRAHELTEALEEEIPPEEKVARPRLPLSAEIESASGYYVFRVADIPEDFYLRIGVIVGEVVHNLRTALDYLFGQIAGYYVGEVPSEGVEGIEFPIEDTSLGFSEKQRIAPEIPTAIWTVIEEAQPYNGGDFLNLLRILSDEDKHGVLKPILINSKPYTFTIDMDVSYPKSFDFDNTHAESYLEVGAEVTRRKFIPFSPDAPQKVEVAAYVTPNVQLPKGDRPVVLGLHEIILEVEKVVHNLTVHLQQLGFQI
jgi:hypothetical protein